MDKKSVQQDKVGDTVQEEIERAQEERSILIQMKLKKIQVKKFYDENPFPGMYTIENIFFQKKHMTNPYINFILDSCKEAKTVLDIGCGTGYISNLLASYNKKIKITSIDFSKAIRIGKKISKKLGNKNIKWIKADFNTYKQNKKYDIIICQGVLHHMPDYQKAVKKVQKMLNPNGKLLLGIYSNWVKKIQKIITPNFFGSNILKNDQMNCPYETGYSKKKILAMFSHYKIEKSYPLLFNYFPNIHLLTKIDSGGLVLYRLSRSIT